MKNLTEHENEQRFYYIIAFMIIICLNVERYHHSCVVNCVERVEW
jgi:hypothetical protein